jgi:hypothetical protein
VRPALVVEAAPRFDLGPGVGKRQEPVCVEALVAQATVERFDEGIVGRLAGPGEVERDAILVGPAVERLRDELGAIIHPDALGRTAGGRDPRHSVDNLLALDALVDIDRQRLAGVGIDTVNARRRRPSNNAPRRAGAKRRRPPTGLQTFRATKMRRKTTSRGPQKTGTTG